MVFLCVKCLKQNLPLEKEDKKGASSGPDRCTRHPNTIMLPEELAKTIATYDDE